MKIEKQPHRDEPIVTISKDTFEIEISEKEIEIVCDWDRGYGGRGIERLYIPTRVMKQLIEEILK